METWERQYEEVKSLDKNPELSGIYAIRCNVTGEVYVGSSYRLKARLRAHTRHLDRGTHANKEMQFAYSFYGKERFSTGILLFCERGGLRDYEQYFINTLDGYKNGFNRMAKANNHPRRFYRRKKAVRVNKQQKRLKRIIEKVESRNPVVCEDCGDVIRNYPEYMKQERGGIICSSCWNTAKDFDIRSAGEYIGKYKIDHSWMDYRMSAARMGDDWKMENTRDNVFKNYEG